MNRPFIWAHRGASAVAPENTLAAFSVAVETGADGLELDIHLSRDGVPVVIHDETLERTTDGTGPVAARTARELCRLDAGRWFGAPFAGARIPLLEEVLELFSDRTRLNLEVKDARAGRAVLDLLRDFPESDVVVSSFDRPSLKRLRASDAALPLAVLSDRGDWHRALRFARQIAAASFHPRVDLVSRPMLAACRRVALPVHAWTVDVPDVARRLFRLGGAGVFTNDPRTLLAAMPGRTAPVSSGLHPPPRLG